MLCELVAHQTKTFPECSGRSKSRLDLASDQYRKFYFFTEPQSVVFCKHRVHFNTRSDSIDEIEPFQFWNKICILYRWKLRSEVLM